MKVTFVFYETFPIACEGNDTAAAVRQLDLRARRDAALHQRAARVAELLARRYACYVQVWDIE